MSKTAELESAALDYHAHPRPGKTAIELTKACDRQADLALAYSCIKVVRTSFCGRGNWPVPRPEPVSKKPAGTRMLLSGSRVAGS